MRHSEKHPYSTILDRHCGIPFCCHVGLILRRIREIMDISQSRLARKADVNLSYICSIENHASNLSIRKLMQICNAMGISSTTIVRILDQDTQCVIRHNQLSAAWAKQCVSWSHASGPFGIAEQDRTLVSDVLQVADAPADPLLQH